MKNILAINGSASKQSSNLQLINEFIAYSGEIFKVTIFEDLKLLPHFDPDLSQVNTPDEVIAFRSKIAQSDGILICTPEYIFNIPSGLKNAIEWCVSTTIFTDKPVAIITGSAQGVKGHEQLINIMKVIMARVDESATMLVSGIKGKIDEDGKLKDYSTLSDLKSLIQSFDHLLT